jgi:hypothetical protein
MGLALEASQRANIVNRFTGIENAVIGGQQAAAPAMRLGPILQGDKMVAIQQNFATGFQGQANPFTHKKSPRNSDILKRNFRHLYATIKATRQTHWGYLCLN